MFSYTKKPISPTPTFEFFNYVLFHHTNYSMNNLINHSTPKPLLTTTLTINTIGSSTIHLARCKGQCFATNVIAQRIIFFLGDILESKCNCCFSSSLGQVDLVF